MIRPGNTKDVLWALVERMPKYEVESLVAILGRRAKQNLKWGPIYNNLHPASRWALIIEEEVQEFKKEALSGDIDKVEDELLDIAASAVSALEALLYMRGQMRENEFNK